MSEGRSTVKIVAVNGSARKNWNTDTLLRSALAGAGSTGAVTEMVNLYDLNYKGCIGCLACKLKNGKSLGRCVVNDDLKAVLDSVDSCDGLILGSPIYLGDVTAMMKVFLERFVFQYLSYDDYSESYFHGNIKRSAFIYTMNVPVQYLEQAGITKLFEKNEMGLARFGYAQTLISTETLQVDDYSRYHMASFNEEDRKKRRQDVFPTDCQKAYDLGISLCQAQ